MSEASTWPAVPRRGAGMRPDAGVTLIELVVTVAIMGIAFTAILGGVMTAVIGSDIHRKQATAETLLRSYAEAVKAETAWEGCTATEADYAGLTAPRTEGGTTYTPAPEWIKFWHPAGDTGSWEDACPLDGSSGLPIDSGLHLIKLTVTSSDGNATETVQVTRRRP